MLNRLLPTDYGNCPRYYSTDRLLRATQLYCTGAHVVSELSV